MLKLLPADRWATMLLAVLQSILTVCLTLSRRSLLLLFNPTVKCGAPPTHAHSLSPLKHREMVKTHRSLQQTPRQPLLCVLPVSSKRERRASGVDDAAHFLSPLLSNKIEVRLLLSIKMRD
ncbi:hypothetical protein ILYODFUR_038996 [Ilyodon furcidens]|uniref:Secreted protein n=1 Tax=Ilyodon furcidens TaxID=33524 RepID=A0ABV0TU91_9TELE